MEREKALDVAYGVAAGLDPAFVQLEVAGSIRRLEPEVKDVELVGIPRLRPTQVDLFTTEDRPFVDEALADLVTWGVLTWDQEVKRNGPKYKRLIHVASGLVIDLFLAQPENYGLQMALRTGPRDFCKLMVMQPQKHGGRGAMPLGMRMDGGFLWRNGQRLDTPTEEAFFAALDVPCWPPEQRSARRLQEWLDLNAKWERGRVD